MNLKNICLIILIFCVACLLPIFESNASSNDANLDYKSNPSNNGRITVGRPNENRIKVIYHLQGETISNSKWVSSNHDVITVDKGGNITLIDEGTSKISFIVDNDVKDSIDIEVFLKEVPAEPIASSIKITLVVFVLFAFAVIVVVINKKNKKK